MLKKLPDLIDPISAVSHDKHFIGTVNQSRFKRLAEFLVVAENEVAVDLQFYFNKAAKLPAADLKIETVMNLQCQRSLQGFDYPVTHHLKAVFVETMALVDDLPEGLEVLELMDEKISLHEWVEEELLLCVPMVPMKEDSEMPSFETDEIEGEALQESEAESKPNPFAALQALKK